jgi:hypothetical protein
MHCLLVVCIGVWAYCEITWDRPGVYKWLRIEGLGGAGGFAYMLLMYSSYFFPACLALESIGQIPAWRCLLLLLVDLVLAVLQFAILAVMLPVRD